MAPSAYPDFLHPVFGSTTVMHPDPRIWLRQKYGWGKATPDISTRHAQPSHHMTLHLVWHWLTVSDRQTMAAVEPCWEKYALLRQRATARAVPHLRVPRLFPADDNTPISMTRANDMGAALLRFDFNYGDLLRWLGGEYTYQHQDRSLLCDVVETLRTASRPPDYPPVKLDEAIRIIHEGVPGKSNFVGKFEDVRAREQLDNRRLDECWDDVTDKFRKEEKMSYHIMFPRFLWKFIPGLFLAIISYIPPKVGRLGDEGRIVCDPSNPITTTDEGMINKQIPDALHPDSDHFNPRVYYGTVMRRYLQLIYNMRLDNPDDEIFLAADDISAAFRWLHYHPDIAVAFASILGPFLVIPVGLIFGARNSPGYYMILGELRSQIAALLDIGEATTDLSNTIVLSDEPTNETIASFQQSTADSKNMGVRSILGRDYKFGFSSFVDDQAVAATRDTILNAITRSVIAARIVFGEPTPARRALCINPRKWKREISHQLLYLGLDWDSRRMELSWPADKQARLASLIDRLSDKPTGFRPDYITVTPVEKAEILDLICHGTLVSDLADFRSIRLQQSLTDAASKADAAFRSSPNANFARRQWWRKTRIAISKEALADLRILRPTLNTDKWSHVWRKPIGLLIPRVPTNTMKSDASMSGIGGWNIELLFMWCLNASDLLSCNIPMRAFHELAHRTTGDPLHINILEFMAIIINVILTLSALMANPQTKHNQHVISVLADNTSALSWMRHAARSRDPEIRTSLAGSQQCGGGPTFSLQNLDGVVGVRYHAGNAGASNMQHLPSGARLAFDNLLRDRRERERGDIRSKNDKTFDSRAKNFGEWAIDAGFTDESLTALAPGQEISVIAAYMFDVVSRGQSLLAKKKSQKFTTQQDPTPLCTKSLVTYLNSAHSFLETFVQRRFSIQDPRGSGHHPLLADILDSRRKWQTTKEKREPYTHRMFDFLYQSVCAAATTDTTAHLDLEASVLDWTCLGVFTGSRANEYAQSTAKRGHFSKVPNSRDAGQWAGWPLGFVDLDFVYYTKSNVLLPHSMLHKAGDSAYELHIRFRFDKSQNNFTIRKYRRLGHKLICPIRASISLILRAKILHKAPYAEPLGVFRYNNNGDYHYLQARDVIRVTRQAVIGAYPNPNHFLRLNITRIVAHSNRVTAAVALNNSGMSIEEIAFRLRWSPPSVHHYLRECSEKIGTLTSNAIKGAIML
ncbi:hypothetical protein MPSEU_000007100 [Mayamaea pseudoterrestris]|nr:hypothetical protein MPSEU_000007100 [Mayamaea pseudoterrestris]